MNILIEIIILILFTTGVIFFILNQRKNIKEWLLYAVVEAEKNLGSKTGKIKLRQVYDEFIRTFPIISKIISFNLFSKFVDNALEEMKRILETNETIKEYISSN